MGSGVVVGGQSPDRTRQTSVRRPRKYRVPNHRSLAPVMTPMKALAEAVNDHRNRQRLVMKPTQERRAPKGADSNTERSSEFASTITGVDDPWRWELKARDSGRGRINSCRTFRIGDRTLMVRQHGTMTFLGIFPLSQIHYSLPRLHRGSLPRVEFNHCRDSHDFAQSDH